MSEQYYTENIRMSTIEKIEKIYEISQAAPYWIIGTQDGIDSRVLIMFSNDCTTTSLFENNLAISANFFVSLIYIYSIYPDKNSDDYKDINHHHSFEVKVNKREIIQKIKGIKEMISFPNHKNSKEILTKLVRMEKEMAILNDFSLSDLYFCYEKYIKNNKNQLLIMANQFQEIVQLKFSDNSSEIYVFGDEF